MGLHQATEPLAIGRKADGVRGHDGRVLAVVAVVALAETALRKPVLAVQARGRPVRHAHLQRRRAHTHVDGPGDGADQQQLADAASAIFGPDADGHDMGLVDHVQSSHEADQEPLPRAPVPRSRPDGAGAADKLAQEGPALVSDAARGDLGPSLAAVVVQRCSQIAGVPVPQRPAKGGRRKESGEGVPLYLGGLSGVALLQRVERDRRQTGSLDPGSCCHNGSTSGVDSNTTSAPRPARTGLLAGPTCSLRIAGRACCRPARGRR